ncbi:hypothetical protein Bbelb_415670 [Branchiostoma belcheri]|nr:hypothetical protein Bbelb_415670 [Branchiostoma belcheri]
MAEGHSLRAPGPLDVNSRNLCLTWKRWKEEILLYLDLAVEDDAAKKRKTLLYLIGENARKVYGTFTIVNAQNAAVAEADRTVEQIVAAFETYCNPKKNETVERYKFFTRSQSNGETFDEYITDLKTLAAECGFGEIRESLIRDRILIGILDGKVRERLLRESNLSLEKCAEICRAAEVSKQSIQTMEQVTVHVVKKKPQAPQASRTSVCKYCAKRHAANKEACPAYGKECASCGKRNHFARACRSGETKQPRSGRNQAQGRKKPLVHMLQEEAVMTVTEEEKTYSMSGPRYAKQVHARMALEGHLVTFQLDLGATCNVMPKHILDSNNIQYKTTGAQRVLTMYNNSQIVSEGETNLKMTNPKTGRRYVVNFVVIDSGSMPLLGSNAIQQIGVVTVHYDRILALSGSKPRLIQSTHSKALTKESLLEVYPDVFSGLGRLPGKCHLEVDESVKPVVHPPRRVPVAMKAQLQKELDKMTEDGVIEPVTMPTPWVSSLVTVLKPTGKLRICIDPRDLNTALKRSHYPAPTIEDILPELKKAKVFSVLDAKSGYWQVVLDEESSLLTTFNTPSGRYKWKRLPFGIKSSPEEFQRRLDQALEGLEGIKPIVDDILVWGEGETMAEAISHHDANLKRLMQRCRERGLKLNAEKVKLRQQEVPFHGHLITSQGLKVDPSKVTAVMKMPRPEDAQGVQRLIGFVTYLAKFLPKLSDICEPLRKLIAKENEFEWTETHESILETLKKMVSAAPVLRYYDPEEELTLQTDASSTGLGAAITQDGQPVAYASRALTDTETRYAQIEKEMLSVVFGLERFHQYTYGRQVRVQTDHKPLEMIVLKPLHAAPKRLQRMLMRLQQYDVKITYKPGKEMFLADTLSRAYLPLEGSRSTTEKEAEQVNMISQFISTPTRDDIRESTIADPEMTTLMTYIREGFPEKEEVPPNLMPYYHVRDELSTQDGIVLRGDRATIPKSLRSRMLTRIHQSHMGIEACLRFAKDCVYWPGMNAEVKDYVSRCDICQSVGNRQQKESLIPHPVTQRPWEKVGVDLFTLHNREYLITVDYYSNFCEIDTCEADTRSNTIIRKLKMQFARHGIPDVVMTDNGPQFASSEFEKFAREWNFKHQTSSPGYPQSNGKVENAVKTTKRLLEKARLAQSDPYLALLDFRNTPSQEIGSSPAQRLFSRRTKATMPIKTNLLQPRVQSDIPSKLQEAKKRQRKYYDRQARDLPDLKAGDIVRCQPMTPTAKQWKKATVVAEVGKRSYEIRTEDGGSYRRNRRHLRKTNEEAPDMTAVEEENNPPCPAPTTPAAETTVPVKHAAAHGQPMTTRSGRVVQPPAHLKDYVRA